MVPRIEHLVTPQWHIWAFSAHPASTYEQVLAEDPDFGLAARPEQEAEQVQDRPVPGGVAFAAVIV